MNMLHTLEQSALNQFNCLNNEERAAYFHAYPNSRFLEILDQPSIAALNLHLKKGALHDDLGVPRDKKLTLKDIARGEHSSSPLTRKRARLARSMRKWHHASIETATKPLVNVYAGEKNIGAVSMLRGRFVFTPSWDAGPNIPERFDAPNPEEMKMQLAQRGLRIETAKKR